MEFVNEGGSEGIDESEKIVQRDCENIFEW